MLFAETQTNRNHVFDGRCVAVCCLRCVRLLASDNKGLSNLMEPHPSAIMVPALLRSLIHYSKYEPFPDSLFHICPIRTHTFPFRFPPLTSLSQLYFALVMFVWSIIKETVYFHMKTSLRQMIPETPAATKPPKTASFHLSPRALLRPLKVKSLLSHCTA